MQAMGITGFTLPTMYRWIRSDRGRKATMHPFAKGHFLGSGQADKVLLEAGLDGESQARAIIEHVKGRLYPGSQTKRGNGGTPEGSRVPPLDE